MERDHSFVEEMFGLDGKAIVVTGACGFFGRIFVRALLSAAGRVIMMSRSDAIHKQHRAYAEEYGEGNVASYQVDFYDRDALDAALRKILAEDSVNVLVNNAYDISLGTGFNSPIGKLEDSPFDQWQKAFESGIYWAVRTTQLIGEQMKGQGGGSIINIASMYGLVSPNLKLYEGTTFFNPPSYGVMKAGLLAFTRYVASFWGGYNVRCNALVPGAFSNTEDESYNAVPKDDPFLKRLEEHTLLKRVGTPGDLLGSLLLLASDSSSYITGQTIIVDGGWTIT